MFHSGKRFAARLLTTLVVPCSLAVTGCGMWDDFRACDYSFSAYFKKEDPIQVLNASTDGTKRARALGDLKEPKQNGGTDNEQDIVVGLLVRAASSEPHAIARLQAIKTLGTFKDPRAVKGLADAYYAADGFEPGTRSHIRLKAMMSLGRTGDPAAIDVLLVRLREPALELGKTNEAEKQLDLDERIAAASALENFKSSRATDALVQILKTEKDVALRDRATQSLQTATGKKLPDNAQAWEDQLYGEKAPSFAEDKPRLMPPVLRTSATQQAPR